MLRTANGEIYTSFGLSLALCSRAMHTLTKESAENNPRPLRKRALKNYPRLRRQLRKRAWNMREAGRHNTKSGCCRFLLLPPESTVAPSVGYCSFNRLLRPLSLLASSVSVALLFYSDDVATGAGYSAVAAAVESAVVCRSL